MANGGTTISLLPVGTATEAVGVAGASAPILQLRGGPVGATAVSALGDARIIVGTDGLIYASENGAAYSPLATGATSPWTRTGTVVSLNLAGDTEVSAFADDATPLGTSTTRWASVNVAPTGARVFAAAADANPTAAMRSGSFDLGTGGASATDVSMTRIAGPLLALNVGEQFGGDISRFESAWTIKTTRTNPGAGDSIIVQGSNAVSTGANTAFAGAPAALQAGDAAATATAQVDGNTASLVAGDAAAAGAGAAATVGGNVFIATGRGNANGGAAVGTGVSGRVIIGDKALNGANVVPPTDQDGTVGKTGKLGTRDAAHGGTDTINARWFEINAVSVVSGDVCFTDPCCPICKQEFAEGEDIVLRVIKADKFAEGHLTRTVPAHYTCH